jgi:hypothetical protein
MPSRLAVALACILWAAPAWSQSSPSSTVVFASIREPSSGVTLVRRADYVSFAITITSSESDFSNRMKSIVEARNVVTDVLTKQGIRFETGPTYLIFEQPGSSTFSSSSSSSYNRPNEALVHVLVPLAKAGGNVLDASSKVAGHLKKVQLPARTSLRYSPLRLAVDNPERHRKELIAKIAEEVSVIKAAMRSNGKVSVSGLASPVQVRQVNDTDVELALSYAVSMEVP